MSLSVASYRNQNSIVSYSNANESYSVARDRNLYVSSLVS